MREHRLYQASFLLRDYGFDLEEMPFTRDGNLPLSTDPKLAWAQMNLSEKPVEINRAEKRELLRVPGIGLKGAEAILIRFTRTPCTDAVCPIFGKVWYDDFNLQRFGRGGSR